MLQNLPPADPRPYAERELDPHDVNNVPVSRRGQVRQRQMALYTAATTVTFVALVASLGSVPIDIQSLITIFWSFKQGRSREVERF